MPYPVGSYQAASLLADINAFGFGCSEINRWENGGWDGHINGFPFNNFAIEEDRGYFLLCSETGSFTPADLDPPTESELAPDQDAGSGVELQPGGDTEPIPAPGGESDPQQDGGDPGAGEEPVIDGFSAAPAWIIGFVMIGFTGQLAKVPNFPKLSRRGARRRTQV